MPNIFANIKMPLHLKQENGRIHIISEDAIKIITVDLQFLILAEFITDALNSFIEESHYDNIRQPVSAPLPYSVNNPLDDNPYLIDRNGSPIFGEDCIADRETVLFIVRACNRYIKGRWLSYVPEPDNYYWARYLGDTNSKKAICFVNTDGSANIIDEETSVVLSKDELDSLKGQIEFYSIVIEMPED